MPVINWQKLNKTKFMKKKILIGLGAFALAALLTLNVSLTKNETNSELSLNSIETVAQAQAETGYPYQTMGYCPGWDWTIGHICTSRYTALSCYYAECYVTY